MARRWRIDARCDDGGGLLDERAGLEGDPGERSDVSRAQGFTRGDGAGQHHRALSTLRIFVLMGVGGVSARGVRGFVVVCRRGFGWLLQDRSPVAQRIAATWDHERARKARRAMGRFMGDKFPPGSGSGGRCSTAATTIGRGQYLAGRGRHQEVDKTCAATDNFGFKAMRDPVHIHYLHKPSST